jgi:hypothetical protein
MKRLLRLVAAAILTSVLQAQTFGDEVWTFQFTQTGSRPFSGYCYGDCVDTFNTRADVVGTFSILLNWQTGAGKPLKLNGSLVNFAQALSTPTGTILQPFDGSGYALLPSEMVLDQSQGHFQYKQSVWRLIPDDFNPFSALEQYDVWFTRTAATFSARLPDYPFASSRIQGAFASLVSVTTAGDYNSDARIDARDYVSWRKSGGTVTNVNLWRNYFGASSASGVTSGLVPEPNSILLLLTGLALATFSRRERGRRNG